LRRDHYGRRSADSAVWNEGEVLIKRRDSHPVRVPVSSNVGNATGTSKIYGLPGARLCNRIIGRTFGGPLRIREGCQMPKSSLVLVRGLILCPVVLGCFSHWLYGQLENGAILGTVSDTSGAVIPAAKVTL